MTVSKLYNDCKKVFNSLPSDCDGIWKRGKARGRTYRAWRPGQSVATVIYHYKGKDDRHSHIGLCMGGDRQVYIFADPSVYGHNEIVQGNTVNAVLAWLKTLRVPR